MGTKFRRLPSPRQHFGEKHPSRQRGPVKYALFFDLDEGARAALRGAPVAEVEACVVDLLTALEGDSAVDDELLL